MKRLSPGQGGTASTQADSSAAGAAPQAQNRLQAPSSSSGERAFLVAVSFSGLSAQRRRGSASGSLHGTAAQARHAARLRADLEAAPLSVDDANFDPVHDPASVPVSGFSLQLTSDPGDLAHDSGALLENAADLADTPSEDHPSLPPPNTLDSDAPPFASAATAPHADSDAARAEFRELVRSAGGAIVGEMLQRRLRPDPATLLGRGKVEELAGAAAASNAELILFDHDLSPTQLRNLEDALPCPVVDRTQLILDIFARHARTREGQLQVELAQLEYMLPRLTGRGRAMSQLGGGIGTRGPGETQLETDRRRIGRRLVQLKRELDAVRRVRRQQRRRRESAPVPTVALVGYTNAGKSTLFNRLTDAGVFASSQMFATLDPKLRAIVLPSRRKVLLSDTVGFIRDLPHTLVTSFRATLEEVEKAEVLLHVQDAAHPQALEHKAEVEKVLGELGVLDKPRIEVWNKIDLLTPPQQAELPPGMPVSAHQGAGIAELLAALDRALVADPLAEQWFLVPQAAGDVLAALEAGTLIQQRTFSVDTPSGSIDAPSGDLVRLRVAGPRSLLGRYRQYWAEPPA